MGDTSTLSIVIKAYDEASAAFKNIQGNVKQMAGNFDTAVSASNKFAIGLAGLATAAVAFGYKSAQAAADAEAQMAKFGATLATMGPKGEAARDGILAASKAALQLGFDDEDTANSIANLFQRTGDLSEALKLNGLAMDLSRAKNIGLSEAQKLVSLVMSGNQRALKLYGIEISDTLTPMQALGELQTKVAGQSVAFSQTFQGQMQVFNQQFENLLEAVGKHLVPMLTQLLQAINPVIDKIGQWSESTAALVQWLEQHRTVLFLVVGAISGALVPALIALAMTIWVTVIPAIVAAGIALAPFIIGGAIVGGVVAGLIWVAHHWDLVKQKVSEFMDRFGFLRPLLAPFFAAGAVVVALVQGILFLIENWNKVIGVIQGVIDKFQALINMFEKLIEKSKIPINFIANVGGSALSAVLPGLGTVAGALHAIVPHAAGGIVTSPHIGLVGEAGPEAIIPLSKMGGMGNNIVVNITGNTISDQLDIRGIADAVSESIMNRLGQNYKFAI